MTRIKFALAVIILLLAASIRTDAQIPAGNPLVEAALAVGAKGLIPAAGPAVSPTSFKPSGARVYVKTYVRQMVDEESQRPEMETMISTFITNFENGTAGRGISNDASAALAFSTAVLYSIAKGAELDDAAFLALVPAFRAYFSSAGVSGASALSKQECYEWALCSGAFVMGLGAAAQSEEDRRKIKVLARTQLIAMLGADIDRITLNGKSISIRKAQPGALSAEGPKNTGLAPGFTFNPPPGWTQQNGWYVYRKQQHPQDPHTYLSALVRFLPAVPAQGAFTDALRRVWKQAAPPELVGKASGMVYRRYVGDGLVSQFLIGQAAEAGRKADTLLTIHLIDCGKAWQPVVIAQTYDDPDPSTSIVRMSAGYSYGTSADMAETMLAQFRCPGARGRPLVDRAALVGNYSFGSASTLQFENVYTGSTFMNVVSYGGTLNLKADGSFDYRFTSVSGRIGSAKYGGAKGAGKWTVKGDLLTCKFSTYDQGDSYKASSHVYRVAGLVKFDDGVKVAVLKSGLKTPINAVTVTDKSDYYATRKK